MATKTTIPPVGPNQPTKSLITLDKHYTNVVRRYKNDMMDHFIDDPTRKETQPKYISAISKEFTYVKPQIGQGYTSPKTIKFDFAGRDTLSISRTNKEKINVTEDKVKLKGVNTNSSNIISTTEYEGISDEDNIFCLISLQPIN